MHIRTHTDHLPGPLAEGNHATDQLTAHMHSNVIEFHNYSHANWRAPKLDLNWPHKKQKRLYHSVTSVKSLIHHICLKVRHS